MERPALLGESEARGLDPLNLKHKVTPCSMQLRGDGVMKQTCGGEHVTRHLGKSLEIDCDRSKSKSRKGGQTSQKSIDGTSAGNWDHMCPHTKVGRCLRKNRDSE